MYSTVKRDSSTPLAAASPETRRSSSRAAVERRSSSSPPQQWRTSGIFVPNGERDMGTNRKVGIRIGGKFMKKFINNYHSFAEFSGGGELLFGE